MVDRRMGEKGAIGTLTAIGIGLFFTFTVVSAYLIPMLFTKIHLVRVVETQYEYNHAELALLSLLSDPEIYNGLSERVWSGAGGDDGWIKNTLNARLSKLVPSEEGTVCYRLSYRGKVLIEPENCKPAYSATAKIALPGGSSEIIKLDTISISSKSGTVEKYCCYEPLPGMRVECLTEEECDNRGWDIGDYDVCNRKEECFQR